MMDFKNARELLDLCSENHCPISTIMRERECDQGETTSEEADGRMRRVLEIMRSSATEPVEKPGKSMGGLIGGEARKLAVRREHGQAVCGTVMSRAITHAMAVLEVNSSMGLIVAAPTAGSSGIVPGLLLALQEEYGLTDDRLIDALYNAGAVGYLAMRNATVAGAVGATALIRQTKKAMEEYPDSLMHKLAKEEGKVSGRTAFDAMRLGDIACLLYTSS